MTLRIHLSKWLAPPSSPRAPDMTSPAYFNDRLEPDDLFGLAESASRGGGEEPASAGGGGYRRLTQTARGTAPERPPKPEGFWVVVP